jgi:hypothetical protein
MRPLLLTLVLIATAATTLPARDADDRRPARRVTEPERRERLKQYLAAFHNLSPAAKARVRQLDKDMQEEDPATRARLLGMLERYALWLSRLPDADRARVQATPAGPERLKVVREVIERQWMDNLPPARKEQLAKATDAERVTLVKRWRQDDRDREADRLRAVRTIQDMAVLSQDERMNKVREELPAYVKNVLEPRLTQRQKQRFKQVPGSYAYFRQVLALSEAHGLTPPGPPDIWDRFREPRRGPKPPE